MNEPRVETKRKMLGSNSLVKTSVTDSCQKLRVVDSEACKVLFENEYNSTLQRGKTVRSWQKFDTRRKTEKRAEINSNKANELSQTNKEYPDIKI